MGLLDVLTGRRKLAQPAPDRLFAITTAYVTLQTGLQITTRGSAAIVFQSLATADFRTIVTDAEEVVRATATDSGTAVETSEDSYGFSWLVLRLGTAGGSFDDLVVGLNAVSSSLEAAGYGDRVLCAVFAFADDRGRPLYLIYNYKRGSFYPFVPAAGGGEGSRDNERELVLKAQLAAELPVEPELTRWFPLWGIPI
ncbi:MAG TPA: hypothetical protein VFN55_19380 [Solirubrobacteraceae bacterium]|nr:hypothetical protein [Solirubrobacteraceae bacterium]